MYRGVVADVVAKVDHWTFVDWRKPNGGHADLLEVRELFGDTVQVAHTVTYKLQRFRIDSINVLQRTRWNP